MTQVCYTDASYDKDLGIAVLGLLLADNEFKLSEISVNSISKAELCAIINAINNTTDNAIIYTDSNSAVTLQSRQQKLIEKNFSNNRGEPLHNAEEYRQILSTIGNRKILFLPGHKPSKQRTAEDHCFSTLDKAVRARLRALRTTIHIEEGRLISNTFENQLLNEEH